MTCKSSFHGKIREIPGIAVDNFNNLQCRAYFLSHCHSDHTQGLFSSKLLDVIKNNKVFIYMSVLTADIIIHDWKDLAVYIKKLEVETTEIILPKMYGYEEQCISVTTIPAGHCLGSIMFLFRTVNETVLYTGDFRIKESDVCKYGQLHDRCNEPIQIDVLYVDTTFIDDKYTSFPKRNICIEQLVDKMKHWLESDPKNGIALSTSAKFGYEFVFNTIMKKINMKVYVDRERYRFYWNHPNLVHSVTNEENDTRIHVCRDWNEHRMHLNCNIVNKDMNFLFIRLSAMLWAGFDLEESPINKVSEKRVDACFPTHCSRSELIYFANYFAPKKICGFPKPYVEINKPIEDFTIIPQENITKRMPLKRKLHVNKKEGKKTDKKVDKAVLRKMFA